MAGIKVESTLMRHSDRSEESGAQTFVLIGQSYLKRGNGGLSITNVGRNSVSVVPFEYEYMPSPYFFSHPPRIRIRIESPSESRIELLLFIRQWNILHVQMSEWDEIPPDEGWITYSHTKQSCLLHISFLVLIYRPHILGSSIWTDWDEHPVKRGDQ